MNAHVSSEAAVNMHLSSNHCSKCKHICIVICNIRVFHRNTRTLAENTPLSPTCGVRYPGCRPVRPTGTSPRAGRPTPSLLHGFNRNALHGSLGLSPLVTTATQVTASTHKTRAADAAALVIATLRNRAGRAAATVHALLAPCIPPAGWLERLRCGGVGWV